MRALLDVNVLVALLDADHVHHARARAWLQRNAAGGWASSPITQNGCIRVLSHPAYPNPLPIAQVIDRLAMAVANPSHRFWADDVSLLDRQTADATRIHGPKQVTNLYLLALSVEHKGRLATFDDSLPLLGIPVANRKHLAVI